MPSAASTFPLPLSTVTATLEGSIGLDALWPSSKLGSFHSATFVEISLSEAVWIDAPAEVMFASPWIRMRAILLSGVVRASCSRERKRGTLLMLVSTSSLKIFRKLVMLVRFPICLVWRFRSDRNCCWRAMRE